MNIETYKKKLLFRSKNRGCKETDIIFAFFAETHLNSLSIEECQDFEEVLNMDDGFVYNYVCENIEHKTTNKILERMKSSFLERNAA